MKVLALIALAVASQAASGGTGKAILHNAPPTRLAIEFPMSLVTSSWGIIARDGSGLVTCADGTLVLLGGWNDVGQAAWSNRNTTNQVYKSTNGGQSWTMVLDHEEDPAQTGPSARWRRRHMLAALNVSIGGVEYIYVIGSDHLDLYRNDVWRGRCSDYGATWERMTANAEWGARALHFVWAMGTTLYVGGGQTDVDDKATIKNDVWKSVDYGATWTLVTASAPWTGRGSISDPLPIYNGKAWLMGGQQYDAGAHVYFNDVWSFDGTTWTQATAAASWSARAYHNTLNFQNRLWVLRGTIPSMLNDAWYSFDGINWTQNSGEAGKADHAGSATVSADGNDLIVMGGTGAGALGVWKLVNQ